VTKLQRKWRSLLSDFITGRFKTLSDKFYSDNSKLAVRRSIWELSFCIRHFGLLCRLRIYHLWNCYRKIVCSLTFSRLI
jgi:hypothetical protein